MFLTPRDVGVPPATHKKMHTHQRNMPHGIAGRMPTSLATMMDIKRQLGQR